MSVVLKAARFRRHKTGGGKAAYWPLAQLQQLYWSKFPLAVPYCTCTSDEVLPQGKITIICFESDSILQCWRRRRRLSSYRPNVSFQI